MRVIAGTARRLQLESPLDKVRPTTDRTKETLFNMIQHNIYDSTVLDLFAGSGALGIECLSRGASHAVFCDNYAVSIDCIKKNLNHTKLIEKASILKYDYGKALDFLQKEERRFDLIFLDPPYRLDLENEALVLIDAMDLLNDDGMIIVETALDTEIDMSRCPHLEIERVKAYKTNKMTFILKKGV